MTVYQSLLIALVSLPFCVLEPELGHEEVNLSTQKPSTPSSTGSK